jgi:hypothetical protein
MFVRVCLELRNWDLEFSSRDWPRPDKAGLAMTIQVAKQLG